jgi:hypothetical protein
MAVTELSADLKGAIETTIRYVPKGERAIFYPTDRARSAWAVDERQIRIESIRNDPGKFSLEKNGFMLITRPTAVKNFLDPEEVKRVYYPEIQALVKEITGAADVLTFGEMVRSDSKKMNDGGQPAFGAHVDYKDRTVREFAGTVLGEKEAERWLARGRYMNMNLWRPITTVERTPLAVCDASTVTPDSLEDSEVRGGLGDPNRPPLYGYNLSYSPEHRWYYVPRMQPDEILAFKIFDTDDKRVMWTGHTAFTDPSSPPDAKPRQSIEIRTISLFPE